MGVTITCKNPKYSFDMGYGGFFNLRKNIAIALDEEFGNHYSTLTSCHSPQDYTNFDNIANRMISEKDLDDDILDFLFQSDCDGKINYRTCKKIYELIKNVDFGNKSFRYTAYAHNDYEELKEFLLDCYKYHKNMIWY